MDKQCVFCEIVGRVRRAEIVFEDEETMAFLDKTPLFPGHSLLVPKEHFHTLVDIPDPLIFRLFTNAKLITQAVEEAMGAEGSFVALNNRVSQSVPHLHIHIVPRRRKDGLRGFFWPRHRYRSEDEQREVAERIRNALNRIERMG
jgi:histidine triad (HIT) family protein